MYMGTVFAGIPEYVDCADRGDTLVGVCRNLAVCVNPTTTIREAVDKHLDGSNIVEGEQIAGISVLAESFVNGRCNVIAHGDILDSEGPVRNAGYTGEYITSTMLHSRLPAAMMTRSDDIEFSDFVNWVLLSLIHAEELNITKDTADTLPITGSSTFGEEYESMFIDAIKAVGNDGEMYQAHWGEVNPRKRINEINNGDTGLLFSFPFGHTKIPLDMSDNQVPRTVPNSTLETIATRGRLRCGIVVDHGQSPGFADYDTDTDKWHGLDVEFCRGLGAALFAADGMIEFIQYDTIEDAFIGLAANESDVFAGAPFNLQNDVTERTTGNGYDFSPIYFYGDDTTGVGGDDKVVNGGYNRALATRESDIQWSRFVRWVTFATIYAEEENITSASDVHLMPVVDYFGESYKQAFRDLILGVGNYGEMYERSIESYIPRSGRNKLNTGNSPQHHSYF